MTTLPHPAHEGNPSFVTIPTKHGKSILVSSEDADLACLRWSIDTNGYAMCSTSVDGGRRSERIHRIIMRRKLGHALNDALWVDHMNGDKLDNRRENLREVTPQQSNFNRGKNVQNASGYKGVQPHGKRWAARIIRNRKTIHLGVYDTPEEAAQAYDRYVRAVHGEYARGNGDLPQQSLWDTQPPTDWTIRSDNTSGFRGVTYYADCKRSWHAAIKVNKKIISLGFFFTPEEAARAYDEAASLHFGAKAKLNFPQDKDANEW